MRFAEDITQLIGNTPLVKINKLEGSENATVLAKLEFMNPAASVKDRLAYAMITDAEKKGILKPSTVIIEPTSGNTGIGLAMMAAVKGYRLIVTMSESVSFERRNLIKAFGAEVVLTPADKGMKGSIDKAEELKQKYGDVFIPMQFENPSNVEMHIKTTAEEIWKDTDGKVDLFVAGAGTGGTITGVSIRLKEKNPKIRSIVVEPKDSPVIAGGEPGSHKIQGIGAGFIPAILRKDMIDEIFHVTNEQSFETARQLVKKEGILCGISSGANVFAALEIAKRPDNKGKVIVVIICDTGERYLSTPLFNKNEELK